MGLLFSLFAEVGSNELDAENFCQHFNNVSYILSDQQEIVYQASFYQDPVNYSKNLHCVVCPRKKNEQDIDCIDVFQDHQIMYEITPLLYEHLRTAPKFRFALVGVEVDDWQTYEELIEDIEDPIHVEGLVLSQTTWKELRYPDSFSKFTDQYVWIPYTLSDID